MPATRPRRAVCRPRVSDAGQAAAGRVRHGGAEYSLCFLSCLRAFAAEPGLYLAAAGSW